MRINSEGLALIKEFEGLFLHAYKDMVGVITIGYGCTKGVKLGQTITLEQAEEMLKAELAEWEARVSQDFPEGLNSNQFSALVSLCYNVGSGPLVGHLGSYIKAGDMDAAAKQFVLWCHAGGKTVPGLLRRREAETKLFNS